MCARVYTLCTRIYIYACIMVTRRARYIHVTRRLNGDDDAGETRKGRLITAAAQYRVKGS